MLLVRVLFPLPDHVTAACGQLLRRDIICNSLELAADGLSAVFPLDKVVHAHHKIGKTDLLRAKLLLDTSHSLDEQFVLFVVFNLILLLVLVAGVKLDKLLLEAFLGIGLVFVPPVNTNDLAKFRPSLALSGLNDNPHDNILEQVPANGLIEHLVALFLLLFDVVYRVGALSLKVAVLSNEHAVCKVGHPLRQVVFIRTSLGRASLLTVLVDHIIKPVILQE